MLVEEMVPRWQSNRTGRPLSPPEIHQKIIWMLRNFHKTTSEYWQRTPDTQKGSQISLKGGRKKYKRKTETKDLGMQVDPGEEVMKEDKLPHSKKSYHWHVCGSFGISESNITRREKQTNKQTNKNRIHA